MATQVQRRKGTTTQHSTFTGASAELTVDTTKNTVVVHDGATAGGTPLAKESGSALSPASLTLPNGTANGVAYLNGSKVLTSGSALTFDGTTLSAYGLTVNNGGSGLNYLQVTNTEGSARFGTDGGYVRILDGANNLSYASNGTSQLFYISGSEQMRLTSTGLGIGTSSPAAPIHTISAGTTQAIFQSTGTSNLVAISDSTSTNAYSNGVGSDGNTLYLRSNGLKRAYIDSAGNLGLGVTPSAWLASSKVIQVGAGGVIEGRSNSPQVMRVSGNTYLDSSGIARYIGTGNAMVYEQYLGVHSWFTAPSGTAGNAISFTQAMTLDASGRLGIGTTSPNVNLEVVTASGNSIIRAGTTSTTGTTLLQAGGDSTQNLTARTWGTANAGSLFGQTLGGWSGLYTDGAASNGLIVGTFTSKPLLFGTGNIERMRLDSSGNVGIGTSSPVVKLHVAGRLRVVENTSIADLGSSATGVYLYNRSNSALTFGTNDTERLRIDSVGNLLVGQTSVYAACDGRISVTKNSASTAAPTIAVVNANASAVFVAFSDSASVFGSITRSGSSTAYNTSSDYRLKNITGPITTSGAYIDSLNPVEGTWKADGSTFVGLIAHEVQEASRTPVATGVKDGEELQGMDYSSAEIIANLIAEVKSLRQRLAAAGI